MANLESLLLATVTGCTFKMDMHPTLIESLPEDVLGEIFRHYLSIVNSPSLEDLLLVCRSWYRIALRRRDLWGSVDVVLRHNDHSEQYKKYINFRFKRSETEVLLDIRIIVTKSALMPIAGEILAILAGPHGAYYKRWRSFEFDGADFSLSEPLKSISQHLSNSLPSLQRITLSNYNTVDVILPHCPSLKDVRFHLVQFRHPPDIGTVQKVHLRWLEQGDLIQTGDLTYLDAAKDIQELALEFWVISPYGSIHFPKDLSHVSTLIMSGINVPSGFYDINFPNLRRLSIPVDVIRIHDIFGSEGIPLYQLNRLDLSKGYHQADGGEALDRIGQILQVCTSVHTLGFTRWHTPFLLRLLWEYLHPTSDDEESFALYQPSYLFSGVAYTLRLTSSFSEETIPLYLTTNYLESLVRDSRLYRANVLSVIGPPPLDHPWVEVLKWITVERSLSNEPY